MLKKSAPNVKLFLYKEISALKTNMITAIENALPVIIVCFFCGFAAITGLDLFKCDEHVCACPLPVLCSKLGFELCAVEGGVLG